MHNVPQTVRAAQAEVDRLSRLQGAFERIKPRPKATPMAVFSSEPYATLTGTDDARSRGFWNELRQAEAAGNLPGGGNQTGWVFTQQKCRFPDYHGRLLTFRRRSPPGRCTEPPGHRTGRVHNKYPPPTLGTYIQENYGDRRKMGFFRH